MPNKTRRDDDNTGATGWAALEQMTDEQAKAAAQADPDAPPLRVGKPMHRMALAKKIRLKLVLSQSEFAERYHIPIAVLMAWERHTVAPDAVATAFLDAIAGDPEGVAKALVKSALSEAAE